MANEDFTRFTGGEQEPLPLTPRAYSNITDDGEDYVAGEAEAFSTPRGEEGAEEVREAPHASVASETIPVQKPKTMVFSLVSLILAGVSLLYGLSGWIGMIFGIAAIVFAIVSRVHLGYFDVKSILGLILGIVGTVFGCFVAIIDLLGVFAEADSFFEEIIEDAINDDFNHQA
ncbi:MAG: DUF4190 domain-containing protein [Clostridia bacterium]|nr:DUF4190 domain-containing protein [Clostridia bacterium]